MDKKNVKDVVDKNDKNWKEAEKAYKKAKEAITTGLTRWSKDYNFAVTYFEDASKLYKNCKAYEKQIECLKYAIECNEKLNDSWAVARNYEAIITTWIENNPQLNFQELVDLTQKSGIYFKAAESGHNTLNLYIKVAKYLQKQQQIQLAENLIKEALNEAEEQEAPSTRMDILNQYVDILVDTQRYDQAAKLYLKEIERTKSEPLKYPLNQYALVVVIMYILQDEIIRANSELQNLLINVPNFHRSSEFKALDTILNAFEKADQKVFDEVVTRSCITSLYPPNIVRTLRKFKVRVVQLHPIQQEANQEFQQQQSQEQQEKFRQKQIDDILGIENQNKEDEEDVQQMIL